MSTEATEELPRESWFELRDSIQAARGPDRKPLLIGIDGDLSVGKSPVASWLAFQLALPTIHLDLFLLPDPERFTWRTYELSHAVDSQLKHPRGPRPVIVEGVQLLDALRKIGREPDFLVFVYRSDTATGGGGPHADAVREYLQREKPWDRAHFKVKGARPQKTNRQRWDRAKRLAAARAENLAAAAAKQHGEGAS